MGTFPYGRLVPYATTNDNSTAHVDFIVDQLELAQTSGDLDGVFGSHGGQLFLHWTRELAQWLKLKYPLALPTRKRLIGLYFEVMLKATEINLVDRCSGMLEKLAGPQGYLERNNVELGLNWGPFEAALHKLMPSNFYQTCFQELVLKSIPILSNVAVQLQIYSGTDFDRQLESILSQITGPPGYAGDLTMTALFILFTQVPRDQLQLYKVYMPQIFYLWSFSPVGSLFPLLSFAAARCLESSLELGEHGLFTREQMQHVVGATHRLLKNPPAIKLPGPSHRLSAASTIVFSLMPRGTEGEVYPLALLGTLVKGIEPYCHPLATADQSQYLGFLVDLVGSFVQRINFERSGEGNWRDERKLNNTLCDEFAVLVLDGLIYGLYSKSRTTMASTMPALMKLAFVSPDVVIPRLLSEIYPSLQGFYTPHRALSCLGLLAALVPVLVRHPKYAFHLTSLLELVAPSIDANDPTRAILAYKIVQVAAVCVPFAPLADSPELALEHVSAIVSGMERPDFTYPTYTDEEASAILKSSTANFESVVNTLFESTFLLLENMPEKSNEIRGSPEFDLTYYAPYAMGCVLHAVPPALLERLTARLVEFVTTPMHTSVDAVAQLCAKLVLAAPPAFSKLLKVLDAAIRNEVLENNAAQLRSFGHRDRNFVWFQSILNMIVSVGGAKVMAHRRELQELALFLRESTRGESVYHVSFLVHHTIQTLVSTFCTDFRTFVGDPTLADWGRTVDLGTLELEWHVPTEAELEFAVEFYAQHVRLSMENVEAELAQSTRSATEFSDFVAHNLTFLRTATGAIAPLVDPLESATFSEGYLDEDGDLSGAIAYKFRVASGPRGTPAVKKRVHAVRSEVGQFLLRSLRTLQREHDSDSTAFKALLFAIKMWFYDVGIEKSARHDHIFKSVYASEKRTFKLHGLRKRLYPRPMMARRAQLYHFQRQTVASRPMLALDRELLVALTESIMSELPEIRFHAECAVYSAIKVMPKSRALVLGNVLEATRAALSGGESGRAESGLQFLAFRSMPNVVKRQYKWLVPFAQLVFEALNSDNHKLVHVAYQLGHQVLEDVRLPCGEQGVPPPACPASLQLAQANQVRRAEALAQIEALTGLITQHAQGHWRSQALAVASLVGVVQSPQVPLKAASLALLASHTTSATLAVKRVAQGAFIKALDHVFFRAQTGNNLGMYQLGANVDGAEGAEGASSSPSPEVFITEMSNTEVPAFFYDFQAMNFSLFTHSPYNHKGWLLWRGVQVQRTQGFKGELRAADAEQLRAFGALLTREWLAAFVQKLAVEPRPEDNHFEIVHGVLFKLLFQLCSLEFTAFKWADVAAVLHGDFDDLNWQRVLAEASFGLASVQRVASAPHAAAALEIAVSLQTSVYRNLAPESLKHWNNYYFTANSAIDHRRLWPLLKDLDALRLDADSSTRDSVGLALRSTLILSHAWKYRLSGDLLFNLCDNFGHPLESIRTEVAKQLAYALSTRPYHLAESLETLTQPHEDMALVEACLDRIAPQASEVDQARAFCLFCETLATRKLSAALLAALLRRVPALIALSNVRDDLLVAQLNSVFKALAALRMGPESLTLVGDLLRQPLGTWHQRVRLLLFVQTVYASNFVEFDRSVLPLVVAHLYDPQNEVRELAADLVRDWTLCTPPHERPQLVAQLECQFGKELGARQLNASATQHGAVLGLGALVAAHPYDMPLPKFVPRVLSALAPFASGVGVVGKACKKIFGDFKRTRQDSWHLDQKRFSSDELESLEGVLFKNYFV